MNWTAVGDWTLWIGILAVIWTWAIWQWIKPRTYSSSVARPRNTAYYRGQRQYALVRDGRRCRICGESRAVDVHHITPRAQGGSDDASNLITLCPTHHALQHRRSR